MLRGDTRALYVCNSNLLPQCGRRVSRRCGLRCSARATQSNIRQFSPSSVGKSFSIEGAAVSMERKDIKPLLSQIAEADKPGVKENTSFTQHWSVRFWRDLKYPKEILDESVSTAQRIQAMSRFLQDAASKAGVFDSPQSLAYWTYHITRMGFFTVNGVLGAASAQLRTRGQGVSNASFDGFGNMLDMGKLLRSGLLVPVSEALLTFYQDHQNIREGAYKMPWDMTTRNHRQTNPAFVLNKMTRFMAEAAGILERRGKNQTEPVWMNSNLYPEYYMNTWHYQTDGWLSDKSASVYETTTETVFVGRQDAMHRQSLIPIGEFVRESFAKDGAGLELLDVATGTGRHATFIKDNFPKMGITQLDLSPFYLDKARENMEYWRKKRGGPNPFDSVAHKDKYLHAPAEKIPVPDASYDIVLSTYLFHELPEESRLEAAKEMARVCRPGGMVVLNDGLQLGDRSAYDPAAGNFQAFNEPNWGSHVATDYGKLFSDQGLVRHKKVLASGSKVLSFRKMIQN